MDLVVFVEVLKCWCVSGVFVLNFLSGARRQVFVVFVVFMMVEKYHFKIEGVAILFVINNLINYFMAPVVAKGINRFGERVILSIEYSFLILVFLAYARPGSAASRRVFTRRGSAAGLL